MFLKRMFTRHIDALLNARTPEEKTDPVIKLRSLVETVLSELRLKELVWERDASDPDVTNAVDRILSKVWQVEDLDELIVLRVFNAKRELIMKAKLFAGDNAVARIEATREILYAEMTTLEAAYERTKDVGREDRKQADEDYTKPLLLTKRVHVDTDEADTIRIV